MALETLDFQQAPFNYGHKDLITKGASYAYWDSSLSKADKCLPDVDLTGICVATGKCHSSVGAPVTVQGRRKRRRSKSLKNKEEMESQRMTHIAVERNRRKLMNDYLAVLRSLMPPSYAQRGDQASIVGGAINFVKELEQLLQFLETHKQAKQKSLDSPPVFANLFSFPQYSTPSTGNNGSVTVQDHYLKAEKGSVVADIAVALIDSHANVKILSRKQPKQLLKMVAGFHSLGLAILHLNVTTVDQMVLCSLSVKVGDECQLNTVNEMTTAIHEMMGKIQEEAISS